MSTTLPSAALVDKQPIHKIEQDCIISKNGDITLAYELLLPEIFSASREDYEQLNQAFVKGSQPMPDNCVLHKLDWVEKEQYGSQPSLEAPQATFLTDYHELHFHGRPYRKHRCFLFITKLAAERTTWSGKLGLLARTRLVPKEALNPKLVAEFMDAAGQLISTLEGVGSAQARLLTARRLTSEDLAGTPAHAGLLEQYLTLSLAAQAQQVDIDFTQGLKVGRQFCTMYSLGNLDDLPMEVETDIPYRHLSSETTAYPISFAAPLGLLLDANHMFSQYIFLDNAAKTIKRLETKKNRLLSLAAGSRQNAINHDFYQSYLDEAVGAKRRPVRVHCNVLLWAESEEELTEARKAVMEGLNTMYCKPRLNTVDIGALYWAGIPGNAGDMPAEETFLTFLEQATAFLALESNYRTSSVPTGIKLCDRLTGTPVLFDWVTGPKERKLIHNLNKFIVGGSGSGKSFFTNHMMRQKADQGDHIVIVDVGGSYQAQCALRNGVMFTYDENKPLSFNPFLFSGALDVEKKEALHNLLRALWKKDDETFSQAEYVSISNGVSLYYAFLRQEKGRIRPCFNTFYEFMKGPYAEFLTQQNAREKEFDLYNFLYVLQPYYKGGDYDFLLNSEAELDLLHEPFIVFELDNIQDHPILYPVVTLMIMETFISKMRKLKGTRKVLLIEEAWKALTKPGMADYIKYIFKTVRKHDGEAIVVTQEVDDLLSNKLVKDAIINNADTKIILDLRKFEKKFKDIANLLSLSEKERTQILSINLNNNPAFGKYNEVFISLGGLLSNVYGVQVSKEEYVTYTTEKREKERLFELEAELGDMPSAIVAYAQELREQETHKKARLRPAHKLQKQAA